MSDPGELVPDESLELFHNFETELHRLVTANRDIRLEGLDKYEKEERANNKQFAELGGDPQNVRLLDRLISEHYNGLRTAANNLDMVALVTRLQHWIIKLARQCPELTESRDRESTLTANLRRLNSFLGYGPRSSDFFQVLESVRDSMSIGTQTRSACSRNAAGTSVQRLTASSNEPERLKSRLPLSSLRFKRVRRSMRKGSGSTAASKLISKNFSTV
jgi:hypothetical protein